MRHNLPHEIVEMIMRLAGAYTWDEKQRPYIAEIRSIGDVACYGVRRSLLHLREIRALRDAYCHYVEGWPLDWDAFHLRVS